MGKYLGVDLGTQKCGLSLGNDITKTSYPHSTLETKNPVSLFESFVSLAQEYSLKAIVIGDPRLHHQGEHPLEALIVSLQCLYAQRKSSLTYELFWVEESYTSQLSTQSERDNPKFSRDAHAAALILQTYLERSL